MFNTSTSLISYRIKSSNGSVLFEGLVPYGLLPFVQKAFLTNQDRLMEFEVATTSHVISRNFSDLPSNTQYDTTNPAHISNRMYQDLITSKELTRIASLNNAAFETWQAQLDAERVQQEQNALNEVATQAQTLYEQSLLNQQQISEEYAQHLRDEAYRLDMLRAQTVTQIAVDPTTSVSALMSEVGHNSDVQRQIAACMRANKEITKLVLASTSTLWNTSYEIMDVVAIQAATDNEIADQLVGKIPETSLLYQSLQRLGILS